MSAVEALLLVLYKYKVALVMFPFDTAARLNPVSIRVSFWTQFVELAKQTQSPVRSSTPSPYNWIGHPVGRSGFFLNSVWSTWNAETKSFGGELREHLSVSSSTAKANYEKLLAQKDELETALREAGVAEELQWHNPDNAQQCRLFVRRDADLENRDDWASQQRWLLNRAEAFLQVFGPIVRAL